MTTNQISLSTQRQRFPVLFLMLLLAAGCDSKQKQAEQFVRSRLPGELRMLQFSTDKQAICGEVGSSRTGRFVRFYSRWQQQQVFYQGGDGFSMRAYSDVCGLGLSDADVAAEEARFLADETARAEEAERARRSEARRAWLEQNAEAIQSLNAAAEKLRGY